MSIRCGFNSGHCRIAWLRSVTVSEAVCKPELRIAPGTCSSHGSSSGRCGFATGGGAAVTSAASAASKAGGAGCPSRRPRSSALPERC